MGGEQFKAGGRRFYINTRNRGAVTNMVNDAFMELSCVVDMNDCSGWWRIAVGDVDRCWAALTMPGYSLPACLTYASASC
ncbi:MAG: hypothetical protein QF773_03235 [Lentisphaeria bacterium]|nr:hypothetical protein [Lentisphaeria bacterium]